MGGVGRKKGGTRKVAFEVDEVYEDSGHVAFKAWKIRVAGEMLDFVRGSGE